MYWGALAGIAFHRDVSAHNFLVSDSHCRDGINPPEFAVLDFGLAVRAHSWCQDWRGACIGVTPVIGLLPHGCISLTDISIWKAIRTKVSNVSTRSESTTILLASWSLKCSLLSGQGQMLRWLLILTPCVDLLRFVWRGDHTGVMHTTFSSNSIVKEARVSSPCAKGLCEHRIWCISFQRFEPCAHPSGLQLPYARVNTTFRRFFL